MSDARQVRRGLWWLSVAVFGSAALQYALYFGIARHLGAAAYGTFSLALTMAVLTGPLGDLGTSVSLVRTVARQPEALATTFGAGLAWRGLSLLPTGVAAIAISQWLGHPDEVAWLLAPLFLATCCDGVATLCSAGFQALERMGTASAILLLRNLLRGAALLLALWCDGGPSFVAWSFLVASLLGMAPALWLLARHTRPRFEWAGLWPTLRDALPFGLGILATLLHGQIDVALLGTWCDASEIGHYHASTRFVLLAQMLPQVVAMATAPLSYRLANQGIETSARVYRVKATALALLGLLGALLLSLHGELLVGLCLGARYAASAPLLLALAPVLFVKFLASSLGDTLGAIGKQRSLTICCWCALAINVLANTWLLPRHGAFGAVLATLLSEACLLVLAATAVLWSGIPLAFRVVLWQPLCIASAAGIAFPWFGAPVALPAALVTALLLWRRWPTQEQRLLW